METAPILIVAAEASADLHAAQVVRRLKEQLPEFSFFGIGGPHLRAEGMETLGRAEDLGVMGFWEVLARLPWILFAYVRVLRRVDATPPSVALLLDYPGFNFRLMKALYRRRIPVIYYICPQVWAWHPERVFTLSRYADQRLVIFPFEEEFFRNYSVEARYVGHPLLDILPEPPQKPPRGPLRIGLFPGSRWGEIRRSLPLFLKTLEMVRSKNPKVQAVVFAASTVDEKALRRRVPSTVGIFTSMEGRYEAMRRLHLAFMTSGTITLETALLGVPGLVAYRLHPLTYRMLKRRVKVPHISIVNLLLNERVLPEFIQDEAVPSRMGEAALRLVEDAGERRRMRERLLSLRGLLRQGSASVVAGELRHYLGT
jgi:lipid-A-disaccharide synthase